MRGCEVDLFRGAERAVLGLARAFYADPGERAAAPARDIALNAPVVAEAIVHVPDAERCAPAARARHSRGVMTRQVVRGLNPLLERSLCRLGHIVDSLVVVFLGR